MRNATLTCDKCRCEEKCRDVRAQAQESEQAAAHLPDADLNCRDYVPVMEFMGFGRAYVPQQKLCELYPAKEGFKAGTIFRELHMPYQPIRGKNLHSKGGEEFA